MLTLAQKQQFHQQGYLVVEGLLSSEDLEPVVAELTERVDVTASALFRAGRIKSLYAEEPFERRLACMTADDRDAASVFADRFACLGPRLFDLLKHPRILDVVESLIGAEISCHPSHNVHARLPGAYTVAHQDVAYFLPEVDASEMIACAVMLVDTQIENGCLWVAPGWSRRGLLDHVPERESLAIPEQILPAAARVPLAVPRGGMVVLHRLLPHGSLPNRTDSVRWSMDARYLPSDQPTGRWFLPGFVARSAVSPDHEAKMQDWLLAVESSEREVALQPHRSQYRWPTVPRGLTNVLDEKS